MTSIELLDVLNNSRALNGQVPMLKCHLHRDIRKTFTNQDDPIFGFAQLLHNGQVDYYNLNEVQSNMIVASKDINHLQAICEFWVNRRATVSILTPQEIADRSIVLLTSMNNANKKLEIDNKHIRSQLALIGNHLAGSVIGELGNDMMFNVAAKLLSTNLEINLGQNKLMIILRRKGWLMIGRSHYEHNMPMQSKIKYMRVYIHRNELTGKMNATTVLRPEGLVALSKKIVSWYIEDLNIKRLEDNIVPLPPSYRDGKKKD